MMEPLIKKPEDSKEKSKEYVFWWKLQETTLVLFLILLVISIVWNWLVLIPAFLLLGFNLFSNFHRIGLLHKKK